MSSSSRKVRSKRDTPVPSLSQVSSSQQGKTPKTGARKLAYIVRALYALIFLAATSSFLSWREVTIRREEKQQQKIKELQDQIAELNKVLVAIDKPHSNVSTAAVSVDDDNSNSTSATFSMKEISARLTALQQELKEVTSRNANDDHRSRFVRSTSGSARKRMTTALQPGFGAQPDDGKYFYRPLGSAAEVNSRLLTDDEVYYIAAMSAAEKGINVGYDNDFGVINTSGFYYQYQHNYSDPCEVHSISYKYDPTCGDDKMKRIDIRQILVTGIQRAGSHYIWEMLNRLGVKVHHEGVGPSGAVSWLYAAHNRFLTRRYMIDNPQKMRRQRFIHIFHQVRHPLRVISTLVTKCADWDAYWKWIGSVRGCDVITRDISPLRRAMLLYVIWNRHIELYADIRFRSETTSPRDICRLAKFDDEFCSRPSTPNVTIVEPSMGSSSENSTSASVAHPLLDLSSLTNGSNVAASLLNSSMSYLRLARLGLSTSIELTDSNNNSTASNISTRVSSSTRRLLSAVTSTDHVRLEDTTSVSGRRLLQGPGDSRLQVRTRAQERFAEFIRHRNQILSEHQGVGGGGVLSFSRSALHDAGMDNMPGSSEGSQSAGFDSRREAAPPLNEALSRVHNRFHADGFPHGEADFDPIHRFRGSYVDHRHESIDPESHHHIDPESHHHIETTQYGRVVFQHENGTLSDLPGGNLAGSRDGNGSGIFGNWNPFGFVGGSGSSNDKGEASSHNSVESHQPSSHNLRRVSHSMPRGSYRDRYGLLHVRGNITRRRPIGRRSRTPRNYSVDSLADFYHKSKKKIVFVPVNITWADLEREDIEIANEIKIMCVEYGYFLDPNEIPQKAESHQFAA